MKKIFLIALSMMFVFAVKAQTTTDEIQLLQSSYGKDKKQLIVEHMKFKDEESVKFWPLYDKYEAERKKLGQARANNILEYSKNYNTLTNEKATELVNAALDNQAALAKLQKKTFKEMSTAITPLRAAQFIQLESYLESVVRKEIATAIPLIDQVHTQEKAK
jgi:hypothetical protein